MLKIKIHKSFSEYFETEGIRIVLTLANGSDIVFIEPKEADSTLRVYVDGELMIYPRASNTCELGVK